MTVTLLMAGVASYAAYAGGEFDCTETTSGDQSLNQNIDVGVTSLADPCILTGPVNGNVFLTDATDVFGYNPGGPTSDTLNGNIEATAGTLLRLGSSMNGNIKAEDVATVAVVGSLNGNVDAKGVGNLQINPGTVSSDVKGEDTRITLIGATVAGSVEAKESTLNTSGINVRDSDVGGNLIASGGADVRIDNFAADDGSNIFGTVEVSDGNLTIANGVDSDTTIFGDVKFLGDGNCDIEADVIIFGEDPREDSDSDCFIP